MYSVYSNQRDTYKLVEKLASKKFNNEMSLLKSLVKDIVDYNDFEITGGRIWELTPKDNSYKICYQIGKVKKIPSNYKIKIIENETLSQLVQKRTILNYETDKLLRKKGIILYSVTGLGEIIKLKSGKFYKYIIGFNADELLQTFYDTLNIINSVATIALKSLSTQKQQKLIEEDLLKASEIQKSLQPEQKCTFHDYEIFGLCMPAQSVGGDYFDYILYAEEEEERLSIVISDAASNGLPAATQSLFLSGAIRMGSNFAPGISKFIGKLNNLIFDKFPYERFVTLFYCELTLSANRLVLYANAGHCPPIHYRSETGKSQELDSTGGFLGLMRNQKFGVENIRMQSGDILVLFTDGITDARNKKDELFGEERILKLIKKHYGDTPEQITSAIAESLKRFSKDSDFSDDQTLVVIKRNLE